MAGSLRARVRALLSRRQRTPLPPASTSVGVDALSCEAAAPSDPVGSPVNPRADARHCGLVDMVMSDWLNAETGELFSGFSVGAQERVLDVGCGDGLAVMFAAQQGAHTTFCDVDPAKVRSLSDRLLERGLTRHAGLWPAATACRCRTGA